METLKNTVSAVAAWSAINPLGVAAIGIALFLVLVVRASRNFGATVKLLLIIGILGTLGVFAWQLASIGIEKKARILEKPVLPRELDSELK